MKFYYDAYHLRFEMPFECPELAPAPDDARKPDVTVVYGEVPESIESDKAGVVYQANPEQFLLKLDGVANYLVDGSERITIERAPEADDGSVRIFLLGSCLAAVLHHREMLALHASAIQTDEGAVLFMGASGNGKSTTLKAFLNRGYQMLSDDVVGIVLDDEGAPQALPGYPQTKLWADAAEKFELDVEPLRQVRPNMKKFAVPTHEQFLAEAVPLRALYVLASVNRDVFDLRPIENAGAFRCVLNQTYRRMFLPGLGMQATHFALATKVAATVPVKMIRRPNAGFTVKHLADMIELDLAGKYEAPEEEEEATLAAFVEAHAAAPEPAQ
ncbi:MAG: hypothetical protein GKS06_05265 [Acidobacteria bacterium]|nr:hypothetical protein [Acidobacteriota bacterium]